MLKQQRSATASLRAGRHLDFRRQASSPDDFHRLPTSAYTSDSLRDS